MAADLENEQPVSAFIEELVGRQTSDGQSTKDERSGTEAKVLIPPLPLQPDQFNAFDLPMQLLRDPDAALMALQAINGFER